MSGETQILKIGDLGNVITGKTPSSSNPEHFGQKVPFVTPTDFGSYSKNVFNSSRFLSESGVQAIGKRLLPKDSILVSCIGSDMGKVVMNKVRCATNQQINTIIPNPKVIDPDFLYYKMVSLYTLLKNMATGGSTMPIVNKTDFENIEIECPPLPIQRRIAAILTALDDKIELNRRMNATL
ncbi:MAG: restriction endonuclease subunit S, partial [Saprospiraceae bacterium]